MADVKSHFAFLGKFDRVADKVQEDLLKTKRIRSDDARDLSEDFRSQLNALGVGSGSHERDDIRKHGGHIAVGLLDRHAVGFDLR